MPVIEHIMTVFQLFINFATICTLLYTLVKFTQKPQETIQKRITDLEKWKEGVDRRLLTGDTHFTSLDDNSRITQQALLAIMDSLLNGDNKEELKKARNNLYEYLSDK